MSEITREALEEIIGPEAMRDYDDASEWGRPMIQRWALKLRGFSDEDLRQETGAYVLEAVIANSRSMPWHFSWCISSACAFEARRRHTAAGHDNDCRGDGIYNLGWNDAYRSQGYTPGPPEPCTCGKGE